MKKIGICACYDSRNYGSMLQAYATQVAIDNLGYKSEYIVYRKKKNFAYILKQVPRLLNRNLMFDKMLVLKKTLALKKHPNQLKNVKIREEAFVRFKNKYYGAFSNPYYGYEELQKGAENYETVLVGSDQLWTPGGLATNFYNLMFVPDEINKVSYATSFGVSNIPWYQKKRTKTYLKRINHLSVREVKGAEIVKSIAGIKAEVVVDPTILLTKEEWEERIPVKRLVEDPYIFCYFLGENKEHRDLANELKMKTRYKIVCTPFLDSYVKEDEEFGDYQLFDIGPDDFVNLIRGAEYILTDSFHGSVFSIIHHKQFIVLNRFKDGEQSRNSRIDSLCEILGLGERRYIPSNDIKEQISKAIDYGYVDTKKEQLRKQSMDFLSSSLKGSVNTDSNQYNYTKSNKHSICNESECTGCFTCSDVCPQKAILMKMDSCGFWHPLIDENLCINCDKCNRICPVNNKPEIKGPTEAYAFQNTDEIRFNSTSGGFFNALATRIIEAGGVVCGAAFDNDMVLRHMFVERKEDLEPLQKSKYVQSSLSGVYQAIKKYLSDGRKVLFVGVGCQAAGLRNYIGKNENLIIVDVVCYGIPSSGLFQDWIDYLNRKYTKVVDVRFRDKTYGYASPNVRVIFEDGKYIESCRDSNLFTDMFFRHLSIRESCYHCHFKTVDRASDITLGDLWTIGKYDRNRDDNKGTTVAFAHTKKGKKICEILGCLRLNTDEIVNTDARKMIECVVPAKSVRRFWQMYREDGFDSMIIQYVPDTKKNKIKYVLKKIMNKTGFSYFWYRREKEKSLGEKYHEAN